ncbi:MAG: glycosyltransferase family 2 protein [Opitutales bacterium]|nr:glycosyltransferase family 2 protein [Opitutales bacterium]
MKKHFAIGVILKNEGAYIAEWIAYHHLLGFDSFYLLDNDSTDDSWQVIGTISKHIPIRKEKFPYLGDANVCFPAYSWILQKAREDEVDYLALIDLDEFFFPESKGGSFRDSLESLFLDDEVSAVGINWCCYGTSGHFLKPEGLVTECFTRHSSKEFSVNHHYKSIVRPERVSHVINTHQMGLHRGKYIHSDGSQLEPHPDHPFGLSQKVCWDGIRLNHYVLKSTEEFILNKALKGCGESGAKIKGEEYYSHHNQNGLNSARLPFPADQIQKTITVWLPPAKSGIMGRAFKRVFRKIKKRWQKFRHCRRKRSLAKEESLT